MIEGDRHSDTAEPPDFPRFRRTVEPPHPRCMIHVTPSSASRTAVSHRSDSSGVERSSRAGVAGTDCVFYDGSILILDLALLGAAGRRAARPQGAQVARVRRARKAQHERAGAAAAHHRGQRARPPRTRARRRPRALSHHRRPRHHRRSSSPPRHPRHHQPALIARCLVHAAVRGHHPTHAASVDRRPRHHRHHQVV